MRMVEGPQSFGYIVLLTREENHGSIMSLNEKSWSVIDVVLGKSFHLRKCLVTMAKGRVLFSSFAAQIYSFTARNFNSTSLRYTVDSIAGTLISGNAAVVLKPMEWRSRMKVNTEAIYQIPQSSSIYYLRGPPAIKNEEAEVEVWAIRESRSDFQDALENRRPEWPTLAQKMTHTAILGEPMSTGLPRRRL